jgi:hypothetical protein
MFRADLIDDLLNLLLRELAAAAVVVKRVVQVSRKSLDVELLDNAAQQRQPGTAHAVHVFV